MFYEVLIIFLIIVVIALVIDRNKQREASELLCKQVNQLARQQQEHSPNHGSSLDAWNTGLDFFFKKKIAQTLDAGLKAGNEYERYQQNRIRTVRQLAE
jgi:hypothetical protein